LQTITVKPDYTVQTVRIANMMFDSISSGYFQLSYNGVTSGTISAAASADDVRHSLEALPDVQTLQVTRTLSAA
jgi:nitrogen regulatory protein PII-like uncharacterized protein